MVNEISETVFSSTNASLIVHKSDKIKSSKIMVVSFGLFFGHFHIGKIKTGEIRGGPKGFLYHQVACHVLVVGSSGREG